MRISVPSRQSTLDSSLIPLINVVFLMLAFFMIAGQIQRTSPVTVNPPLSISETRQGDFSAVVHVAADGQVFLDRVPLELDQLTSTMSEQLDAAADRDSYKVLLQADGVLPADTLRSVLKRLRAAGLLKVSIATRQDRSDTE